MVSIRIYTYQNEFVITSEGDFSRDGISPIMSLAGPTIFFMAFDVSIASCKHKSNVFNYKINSDDNRTCLQHGRFEIGARNRIMNVHCNYNLSMVDKNIVRKFILRKINYSKIIIYGKLQHLFWVNIFKAKGTIFF